MARWEAGDTAAEVRRAKGREGRIKYRKRQKEETNGGRKERTGVSMT